jgi:hypothetical protein
MHWPLPSSRDGIGGKDRRKEERTLGDEDWIVWGERIIERVGESIGVERWKVKKSKYGTSCRTDGDGRENIKKEKDYIWKERYEGLRKEEERLEGYDGWEEGWEQMRRKDGKR